MKKLILIMFAIAVTLAIVSCTKNEDNAGGGGTVSAFNYPISQLYGTWDCTHVLVDYNWQEVSNMFSATFYEDGSYSGRGVLGNGTGTYQAVGNTITTYVNGSMFYKYDVIEFNGSTAQLKMYKGTTQAEIENSTKVIKVRKSEVIVVSPVE